MSNLTTALFGPLDKGACSYFLLITVLFFISLVLVLGSEIVYIYQNAHRVSFRMISNGFLIAFNIFVAYFVNRLLYTMCSKSLA